MYKVKLRTKLTCFRSSGIESTTTNVNLKLVNFSLHMLHGILENPQSDYEIQKVFSCFLELREFFQKRVQLYIRT